MGYGVVCQACGIEAPSKKIQFYQNIGALLVRFHSGVDGRLCKSCVHKYFWKTTSITAAVGWLGTLSIVIGPCFVIHNIFRYFTALGMPSVPAGATIPQLTPDALDRLRPYSNEIIDLLNSNMLLDDVALSIAPKANATPGQVLQYTIRLIQAMQVQQQPQPLPAQRGFDVVMPPQPAPVVSAGGGYVPPPLPSTRVQPADTAPPPPQLGA